MRNLTLVLGLLFLTTASSGQSRWDPSKPESWNQEYRQREGQFRPNRFVVDVIKSLPPGKVLDIMMGQGRNALFLAQEGWDVTGFDFSDVAVDQARQAAHAMGLRLNAVLAGGAAFDYGEEQWDLVICVYANESAGPDGATRILASLKPGGHVLVEGFHHDSFWGGFPSNYLLRTFGEFEVLRYEDAVGNPDPTWSDGNDFRYVRLFARKPSP